MPYSNAIFILVVFKRLDLFLLLSLSFLCCVYFYCLLCNLSNQKLAQNLSKRDLKDPVIRNLENLRKLTQCQCWEKFWKCTELFLARGGRKYFASFWHQAARKTSGTEWFHLLFSLNFDQFYQITFKPITASISHSDHMDWDVKTWYMYISTWQIWSGLNSWLLWD